MAKVDEQKFLQFYDQKVTKIYRYIYFRVGSEEVAQDLSSEAFLKTWEYIKNSKEIKNLSAIIYQISRNLIADYFRQNFRFPISIDDISEKNITQSTEELLVLIDKNLDLERIRTSLKYLKDEYQELIIWRYIEDMSIEEIAQITEKSEAAVRTSLSRAIRSLKEAIENGKIEAIDSNKKV